MDDQDLDVEPVDLNAAAHELICALQDADRHIVAALRLSVAMAVQSVSRRHADEVEAGPGRDGELALMDLWSAVGRFIAAAEAHKTTEGATP